MAQVSKKLSILNKMQKNGWKRRLATCIISANIPEGGLSMENYSDDVQFINVIQHFLMYDMASFQTETNSLEYLSTGHVILELSGGRPVDLHAPALFWMRKGGFYRIRMAESERRTSEHIYTDFDGPRTERILDYLERKFPGGSLVPSDPKQVNETFSEMLRCFRSDPVKYHARMVFCVEKLMLLIADSGSAVSNPEDPFGLGLFAEEIRSDPFQVFDLRAMAAKAHISPAHFRRLFRKRMRMPFAAYIRNQRMSRAAELLRSTGIRIKEIAFTCRFDSLIEFSRSFRRYAGMSPREYRKQKDVPRKQSV